MSALDHPHLSPKEVVAAKLIAAFAPAGVDAMQAKGLVEEIIDNLDEYISAELHDAIDEIEARLEKLDAHQHHLGLGMGSTSRPEGFASKGSKP